MEIDLDEVVMIFSVKEPHRMRLTNILRDWGALLHFGIGTRQPRRLELLHFSVLYTEMLVLGLDVSSRTKQKSLALEDKSLALNIKSLLT